MQMCVDVKAFDKIRPAWGCRVADDCRSRLASEAQNLCTQKYIRR